MPGLTSNQCVVSKSTDKSYILGGQGQAVANVNIVKQSAEQRKSLKQALIEWLKKSLGNSRVL